MAQNDPQNEIDEEALGQIKSPMGDTEPPPDAKTQEEMTDLEVKKKQAELQTLLTTIDSLREHQQTLKLQNKDLEQNIGFRKFFPIILFACTCIWIIVVTFLVIKFGRHGDNLSDAILITLLGTTTVSVLAFFKCVTNYLFPSPQNSTEPSHSDKPDSIPKS